MIKPSQRIKLMFCSSSMDGGGSERQLLYLMKGLDRTRFEIGLYLLYRQGNLLPDVPDDIPIVSFWDQYQISKWNWPGKIHRDQVRHLANTLERENTDVLYDRLFHIALITGPANSLLRKNSSLDRGVGRVSAIVSPPSHDVVRSERRWLWWKRRLLRQSYGNATKLLAVSKRTAEDACQFYDLPQEKFEIVPSPVDISRIDEQANAPILSFESAKMWQFRGNPRILSIGRLSSEKGHRFLIEAVAQFNRFTREGLPPVDLHLLGDGICKSQLVDQARYLGQQSHVFFHGHVDNPFPYLKQCELFVLPSLYEGLPNVVLEAMACRAPILATDTVSGAGELLREHPLGTLAVPGDAAALANQIKDRFLNREIWEGRLNSARDFVRERHDLAGWIARMSQILVDSNQSKGT